jgi:hypothetical protein
LRTDTNPNNDANSDFITNDGYANYTDTEYGHAHVIVADNSCPIDCNTNHSRPNERIANNWCTHFRITHDRVSDYDSTHDRSTNHVCANNRSTDFICTSHTLSYTT